MPIPRGGSRCSTAWSTAGRRPTRRSPLGRRLHRRRAREGRRRGALGPLRAGAAADQRIPLRRLMHRPGSRGRAMTPPIAGPDSPSCSRRQVLGTVANGFGLLGLAGLLAEARPVSRRGASPSVEPARRPAAAPRRQGQAGHLHLPERRPVARRPARPQGPPGRRPRQAAALREAQAGADDHREPDGLPLPVRPARPSRASRSASSCPTSPPASTTCA